MYDSLTLMEQIFCSCSPPRKCNCTKLWGVHCSNIRPGASPLIFNWFTIAVIALVYWRNKRVCSSGCVRRTLFEQIFGSYSSPRKCIVSKIGGIHRSNIRRRASPLIFNWFRPEKKLVYQARPHQFLTVTLFIATSLYCNNVTNRHVIAMACARACSSSSSI